jgi:hypothetical protein
MRVDNLLSEPFILIPDPQDSDLPRRPTPPDLVFGAVKDAHASLPTDPVLLKSDLLPTYHLASVVDVIRGEVCRLSKLHLRT